MHNAKIGILGLGYVGLLLSIAFAQQYDVKGIIPNEFVAGRL